MTPGEALVELTITDLAVGGRGVARLPEGKVVLVEGGLPGERVRARMIRSRREYDEARVEEVLNPAADRVEPHCPLYDRCGGCDLMHLDYPAQVAAKAAWVDETLGRAGVELATQPLASPLAWGYRNRVRFQVDGGRVGFYTRGSQDLVPVGHCPVAADPINQVLAGLGDQVPEYLTWLEALAGETPPVFLTMGLTQKVRPETRRRLADLGRQAGAAGVRLWSRGLEPWFPGSSKGVTYYQRDGLSLRAFPGLFCQVNFGANQMLIDLVLELAGPGEGRPCLDLYAGSGNFSLPLAAAGWRVVASESAAAAVRLGRWQAEDQGLADNIRFRRVDAARLVREHAQAKREYDLVVLDPPRAGAKGMMPLLAALKPGRIVYISCHPAALARDAAALMREGYAPAGLWALDLFPQTGHVEAILALDRQA